MTARQTILLVPLVYAAACIEPYNPPSSKVDIQPLVVDGFLNGTSGSASVKITRAIPLSLSIPSPLETGATVSIESESGTSYSLSEVHDGIYQADNLIIESSSDYRLRIHTKSGRSYTSDYVEMRQAPALDSVSWRPEATGTRIYVSGHDATNSTTYYRYLFTETWEYRAAYFSFFKKVGNVPVFRTDTEQVYTCWNSTISTEILTVSTKRLSKDVVSMFPIRFLRAGISLLSRTYSINVQQRAISQAEYEYWDLIRKTTESLGGLFDPLPSQVIGNVHNDNDEAEQVLGYFSGGFAQEKRIFISFYDLPDNIRKVDPRDFLCEPRFVPIDHLDLIGTDVYLEQIGQPPVGYSAVIPNCGDCRSLGGDNIKPNFWPN